MADLAELLFEKPFKSPVDRRCQELGISREEFEVAMAYEADPALWQTDLSTTQRG